MFSAEPLPSPEELRVVGVERDLPLAPDVIYSQDAEAALLLADLYPLTPQVFAAHGDREDVWLPPQLAGRRRPRGRVRRPHRRARAGGRAAAAARPPAPAGRPRPVRLARPAAGAAGQGAGPARRRLRLPARNRPARARRSADRARRRRRPRARPRARRSSRRWPRGGPPTSTATRAATAGSRPSATSCSRPTASRAAPSRARPTFERLRAELDDYDPALGPAGRELAQAHDARAHAQELVAAFDEVKPRRDPVDAPLRELARVVRVEAASAPARAARTRARPRPRAGRGTERSSASSPRPASATSSSRARSRSYAARPTRPPPARSSGWSGRRAVASARAARAKSLIRGMTDLRLAPMVVARHTDELKLCGRARLTRLLWPLTANFSPQHLPPSPS